MSKNNVVFLKSIICNGIILIVFSVLFMLIYSIFSLHLKILGIFNAITIFCGFFGSSWYSNIKTQGHNIFIMLFITIGFIGALIAFSLVMGGIDWIILISKLIFVILGWLFGIILSQKLYKF
ncbi:MAG: hypothetical protein RR233_05625 [Clostridiales bacterium]